MDLAKNFHFPLNISNVMALLANRNNRRKKKFNFIILVDRCARILCSTKPVQSAVTNKQSATVKRELYIHFTDSFFFTSCQCLKWGIYLNEILKCECKWMSKFWCDVLMPKHTEVLSRMERFLLFCFVVATLSFSIPRIFSEWNFVFKHFHKVCMYL